MPLGVLRSLLGSLVFLSAPTTLLAGGEPADGATAAIGAKDHHRMTYTARGDFDEIKQYIVDAIINRGMVINNVSHIGDMLQRTGKDLGDADKIFFKAEALEFCSATVSRATMEADPHNIVFCPYIIAIYALPGDPETVYISFRRPTLIGTPQSRSSLQAVEDLLNGIIRDALQWL